MWNHTKQFAYTCFVFKVVRGSVFRHPCSTAAGRTDLFCCLLQCNVNFSNRHHVPVCGDIRPASTFLYGGFLLVTIIYTFKHPHRQCVLYISVCLRNSGADKLQSHYLCLCKPHPLAPSGLAESAVWLNNAVEFIRKLTVTRLLNKLPIL